MERNNNGNEVRSAGGNDFEVEGQEGRARDVRALADLELMLVGGGDGGTDWGG